MRALAADNEASRQQAVVSACCLLATPPVSLMRKTGRRRRFGLGWATRLCCLLPAACCLLGALRLVEQAVWPVPARATGPLQRNHLAASASHRPDSLWYIWRPYFP